MTRTCVGQWVQMIKALLSSNHPQINIASLYTFMWCLWKSRNDNRFCRKSRSPLQVFAAAEAILKETSLEVTTPPLINGAMVSTETNKAVLAKDHAENQNQFTLQATPTPGKTIMDISNIQALLSTQMQHGVQDLKVDRRLRV